MTRPIFNEELANEVFDKRVEMIEKMSGKEYTDKEVWRKKWLKVCKENHEIITDAAQRGLSEVYKD